ncbi:hypothetical protein WG66_001871 [Moniliophthora roreri]|nr:hypothetical protein WG66_001871 [Moniliophthora roreri]
MLSGTPKSSSNPSANLEEWIKEVKRQLSQAAQSSVRNSEWRIPSSVMEGGMALDTWIENIALRCIVRETSLYRRCKQEKRPYEFTNPREAIAHAIERTQNMQPTRPNEEINDISMIPIYSDDGACLDSDNTTRPHSLDSLDGLIELSSRGDGHIGWTMIKQCAAILRRRGTLLSNQLQELRHGMDIAHSRERDLDERYRALTLSEKNLLQQVAAQGDKISLAETVADLERRESELTAREAEFAARVESFSKREEDLWRLETLRTEIGEQRYHSDSSVTPGRAKESSILREKLRKAREEEAKQVKANAQAIREREQIVKAKEAELTRLDDQLRARGVEQDARENGLKQMKEDLRKVRDDLEQSKGELQERAIVLRGREARVEERERVQLEKEAALRRATNALQDRETALQRGETDLAQRVTLQDAEGASLSQRDELVSAREHIASEREAFLSAREFELRKLDEMLRERQESLSESLAEYQVDLLDLQTRKDHLKTWQDVLYDIERRLVEREAVLEAKSRDLAGRERRVADAESLLSEEKALHQQNVSRATESYQQAKNRMRQREEEVKAEQERLESREAQLNAREHSWEARLQQREKDLLEREAQFQALEKDLQSREQQLQGRQESAEARLNHREGDLLARERIVASQEEHLGNLWTRINEQVLEQPQAQSASPASRNPFNSLNRGIPFTPTGMTEMSIAPPDPGVPHRQMVRAPDTRLLPLPNPSQYSLQSTAASETAVSSNASTGVAGQTTFSHGSKFQIFGGNFFNVHGNLSDSDIHTQVHQSSRGWRWWQ